MEYSFINVHTKSKVALETDKYLVHRRIKSKLSYSDNYLEIKVLPNNEEELKYYIDACADFFKDKGINFIHLALPENSELDKKLVKYLKKENYTKMDFDLYVLNVNGYEFLEEDCNYSVEELDKKDYAQYMEFSYKQDLEVANEEWAEHNKDSIYENIRNDDIIQLVSKDNDKIVAGVNIILDDDYFEIDNLYVIEKYRRQGIAKKLVDFAIKNFKKNNIILVADSDDTPKYMYEKMGFELVSSKTYFLKSER